MPECKVQSARGINFLMSCADFAQFSVQFSYTEEFSARFLQLQEFLAGNYNFRQRQNLSVWSLEGNSYSLYVLTLCLVANMCNFVRFFHSSTA